ASLRAHLSRLLSLFFFTAPTTSAIYTLSLHDALPIFRMSSVFPLNANADVREATRNACTRVNALMISSAMPSEKYSFSESALMRSEEHTSELQSRFDLVCRLLLEKKKLNCHQISSKPV